MSHITARDRYEWAHHPVTQELSAQLSATKLEAMEAWAQEKFVRETAEMTAQANAKALGGVDALTQVIELIEGYKSEAAEVAHV